MNVLNADIVNALTYLIPEPPAFLCVGGPSHGAIMTLPEDHTTKVGYGDMVVVSPCYTFEKLLYADGAGKDRIFRVLVYNESGGP